MKIFIVKLYQLYKRKGDLNPEMQVTGYITLVIYFAIFCIALPVIEIVSLKFYDDNLKVNQFIFIVTSLLISYFVYTKTFNYFFKQRRMKALEERFKKHYIPTGIIYLIVILIPVILLLIGPTLTVLLTGGEILGNRINGLLE